MRPRGDGLYVDCTFGFGGHSRALLAAGAGQVIAIDRDPTAERSVTDDLRSERFALVHSDFRHLEKVLASRAIGKVDGILADLGVSSMQLDSPERGFSFRQAGPLDMRMDSSQGPTLHDRLTEVDETELADVIWKYGDERHSRRVARAIVAARERGALTDTAALAAIVRRAAGGGRWHRIDPATRTFQALRIWVNDELEGLDRFLETAAGALAIDGRLIVIAFHSLEDRIVKQTFRRVAEGQASLRVLTKRPVVPDAADAERNPRARSARLRVLANLS